MTPDPAEQDPQTGLPPGWSVTGVPKVSQPAGPTGPAEVSLSLSNPPKPAAQAPPAALPAGWSEGAAKPKADEAPGWFSDVWDIAKRVAHNVGIPETLDAATKAASGNLSEFPQTFAAILATKPKLVNAVMGASQAAAESGGDPVKFLLKPQVDELSKAWDLAKQGRGVEAFGHAVAGVTPGFGPPLAHVAEELGQSGGSREGVNNAIGDVLTLGAGVAAPEAAAEILPGIQTAMAQRAAGQMPMRASRFMTDLMEAVKPSHATPYESVDVARATPYLAAEQGAMPIETPAHLVEAGDSISEQMQHKMGEFVQQAPGYIIKRNIAREAIQQISNTDKTFLPEAAKELAKYDLNQPVTLSRAERIIADLNKKNRAILTAADKPDVATALGTNPAFAARYHAVEALRDGMLDAFDDMGIQGVGDMRKDWASVIKIRNAADRVRYAGERKVAGTGMTGPLVDLAKKVIPATGAAVGAELGGPVGAGAGDIVAQSAVRALPLGNKSINQLIERAFKRLGLQQPPPWPVVPPARPVAGLLNAPAKPLGPAQYGTPTVGLGRVASPVVGGTEQPTIFGQRQLTAPAPQGEVTRTNLPPSDLYKFTPERGPNQIPPMVGGTSQPAVFGNRKQIAQGAISGELTGTRLPPSDLFKGSLPNVPYALEARPILVKDPKTGRFQRVFTSEAKGEPLPPAEVQRNQPPAATIPGVSRADESGLTQVHHGGTQTISEIDQGRLQRRDTGFYGTGFYTAKTPQVAKMYGPKVTTFDVQPWAKVLNSALDPVKADPALVRAVQQDYYDSAYAAAKSRGKLPALTAEVDAIGENPLDWKNAVDRYAQKHGVDIIRHSDGEIVVKNPNALKSKALPKKDKD